MCPFCNLDVETIQHVLLQCGFAKTCWSVSGVNMAVIMDGDYNSWFFNVAETQSEVLVLEAAMISLKIWAVRNDVLWKNKSCSAREVVRSARVVLDQWKNAQSQKYGALLVDDINNVSELWRKPTLNTVKVNVDEAFFEAQNKFRFGCVARDSNSRLLVAFFASRVGLVQPEVAEIIGVKEALNWIKRKRSRLVVPSVQELAKDPNMVSIPSRYIQHHQNSQSNNVITNSVSLDDQIPVINFQNLFLSDDPSELSNLHSACKDWGFFQLVNHGISDSLIEKVKKGIEELFNLPVEEKKKLCQLPGDIEGFGQSFVFTEEQKLDWNDYLLIFTLPLALRKPHLFPNLPTTLKESLEIYSLELAKLARDLICQMEKILGIKNNEISNLFEDGMQFYSINCYPRCPEPEKVIGLTHHSDGGCLTFLLHVNQVQGLQVKKDGIITRRGVDFPSWTRLFLSFQMLSKAVLTPGRGALAKGHSQKRWRELSLTANMTTVGNGGAIPGANPSNTAAVNGALVRNRQNQERIMLNHNFSIKLNDHNFLLWKQLQQVLDAIRGDRLLRYIKEPPPGEVLSDRDHVAAIFKGLPSEYDTFVISLNTRVKNYTVGEIEAFLLASELRIEKSNKEIDLSANLMTHE
uniref:Uncharacterized protein n=1 Tax=Cannabis sativa TaxID=3483 RepID=A0A803Q486_CANSA